MDGHSLHSGDLVAATVTKVVPFGLLVESTAGVPGLVRGAHAEIGTRLRLRVVAFDDANRRFSATLV